MAEVGRPEYRPEQERPWKAALDAAGRLEYVLAEFVEAQGKVGADEVDVSLAAQVLAARASMATAEGVHMMRQELTRISSQIEQLRRDVSK